MNRPLLHLLIAGLVAGLGAHHAIAQSPTPPALPSSAPAVELEDWEVRRLHFLDVIKQVQKNDVLARREFERLVRGFEQRPFTVTPLEATDYIGAVFVPQVGVEKMLPLVAAQAALGLYDVWRFGSSLSEAELLEGERFMRRPLALAGPDEVTKARAFMQDNPAKASRLVLEGLQLANGERIGRRYNPRWVQTLGRCEPEAAATCPKHRDVPMTEWDDIWERVRQRVIEYYQVEPTPPAQAASAPAPAAASAPR